TPNVKQPKFRWLSVGAAFAIIVWILASVGFGFYVANVANYAKTYGALAGVIVFLFWLWITNLALLLGAEVDAELERARELLAGVPAESQIQLPVRDDAKIRKDEAKRRSDIAAAQELHREEPRVSRRGHEAAAPRRKVADSETSVRCECADPATPPSRNPHHARPGGPGDDRSIRDRHGVSRIRRYRRGIRRRRARDAASHERVHGRVRGDEHLPRPALRRRRPQTCDDRRPHRLRGRERARRPRPEPRVALGCPTVARGVRGRRDDRLAGGHPGSVRRCAGAEAHEPGDDDLLHRPRDRAHRRRVAAHGGAVAPDLLGRRRIRPAAHRRGRDPAPGNSSARRA